MMYAYTVFLELLMRHWRVVVYLVLFSTVFIRKSRIADDVDSADNAVAWLVRVCACNVSVALAAGIFATSQLGAATPRWLTLYMT